MIGPHAQRGGAWINHIHRLPNGAPVKAVDDYQLLWQAYDINPTLYTVFRKYWDGSQTYDDAPMSVKKDRARQYFNSFLDGTFDQNKHKVRAIGLWNEEYAASQSPIEKQRRIDQDRAFIEVWVAEYKSRYPHIHIHSTSAAPGNSIPLGIAALAHEFRNQLLFVLDYHAYTAVSGNAIVPGEHVWCSGRWMQDDVLYRQNGYFVRWFSGESGATGWNVGENRFDYGGWKEERVHGGNLQSYLTVTVNDNLSRWKAWNATHNGRFMGAVQFTSNNNADSRWVSYELLDEWGPMADYVKAHSGTVPPPPPPPPQNTWNKLVILLPQNTTKAQYLTVAGDVAYGTKTEIAFSADSAFDPPSLVGNHKVIVYNVQQWGGEEALEQWALTRFGSLPTIEYRTGY